ncbi:tRNA-binding protein [Candidatus Uhrbacteria bacterium]|nr:tRNA-binding protein [Candidatus Uhrbacteria bacterium]
MQQMATFDDFLKVDIRVGTVVDVEDFPEARKPAYVLVIDFGTAIGRKRSSAQLTRRYRKEEIIGKQVMAVVNMPSKQIGPFRSEVLTLGVADGDGNAVLIAPTHAVPNGGRLY